MHKKTILLDLTLPELQNYLTNVGQPSFRAKQIFGWLHKGIPFSEMTNIPKDLRDALQQQCFDLPLSIYSNNASQRDETVKFLFACEDGNLVEGVLMHYHYGYTLCISTQVGCRMGCLFCASTLHGCVRNLSAGEMLSQVLLANRFLGEKGSVGHVVLMGSGEPLDNYVQTVRFLRLINHPDGLNISLRNISVSTCGLVPQILRLAEEKLPVTLSVSLHAPTDSIRRVTMPIANRYTISDLLAAVKQYEQRTGRRVVFEYALMHGVNSQPQHAHALADLVGGMRCHVNLIPLNPVRERRLSSAGAEEVTAFLNVLEKRNISATIRREMGTDIAGACGQLRHQHLKTEEKIDRISGEE